eukprot:TRINITY_DN2958_c0_g1_i4.p1 TRINITY_DN2958_c0_g1~~TRINITY_DN2958_c0_g1_i4.p1  ORF type:complete len:722 (-),score=194.08 TRINITY_DN2958_c0_g1_i4:149-2314(-)
MTRLRLLWVYSLFVLSVCARIVPYVPSAGPDDEHSHGSNVVHKCIHDEVQRAHGPPKLVSVQHKHDMSKRDVAINVSLTTEPIRILFDYSSLDQGADPYTCYSAGSIVLNRVGGDYTCSAKDVVTPAMAYWISHVAIPLAKAQWENVLRVNRIVSRLAFPNVTGQTDCWAYSGFQPKPVPRQYFTGVTGTDLIIFITARPVVSDCMAIPNGAIPDPGCSNSSSVLAFAGSCLAALDTKRPLAGYFNYNPALMDAKSIQAGTIDYKAMGTTIHEITHILGFSFGNYGLWSFRTPSGNVVSATIDIDGQTVIRTPTVVAAVQEQFGCSTLEGGILEDMGGTSTRNSHWKKLYFGNEYMTGEASSYPVFSKITLALLKDSGWYDPDFTSPEIMPLQWGLNMGCAFATAGCAGRPNSMPYRCTAVVQSQYSCTVDRMAKGRCSIPSERNNPNQTDPLTGQCYAIGDFAGSQCYVPDNAPQEVFDSGEQYGPESRCYDSSLVSGVPVGTAVTQRCYRTACAGSTRLKVQLDGLWYNCTPGTTLTPDEWGGSLRCPDNYNLCWHAANDPTWPEFVSIDPDRGNPGDWVTIRGSGFVAGTTVSIQAGCKNTQVVSSTEIRTQLAGNDEFRNPTNLIAQHVAVVIKTPNGRSAVGVGSFVVQVKIDASFFNSLFEYFGQYPLYTGLVCVGIVFFISMAVFYCFRERRKALYGRRMKEEYDFKEEAGARA